MREKTIEQDKYWDFKKHMEFVKIWATILVAECDVPEKLQQKTSSKNVNKSVKILWEDSLIVMEEK